MDLEEIKINKIIIHVLDSDNNKLILSKKLINYGSHFEDFLKMHLVKILEGDDAKNCVFREDSQVRDILNSKKEFVGKSQILAKNLFLLMQKYRKIPAADLIVLEFNYSECQWLALLKVNYISSYIYDNEIDVIANRGNVFPKSKTTHLKEAVIINLNNYSLRVKEKKYEVDGIKANYFSGYFLRCSAGISDREIINTIKRSLDYVRNKYLKSDIEILKHTFQSRKAIADQYEKFGLIDTNQLANEVFNDNKEAREEFIERLKKNRLDKTKFIIKNGETVERVSKQKIVTETGIVIVVPVSRNNFNNIAFIKDARNNIYINVKNIGKLKNY
ncbi:MAG: nucleoid-associated protein [Candidatus Galacturonibacter soehngenii]|nr:nucleoid-associated protein [Candidatus Galacturonibacter soehngenii]